MIAASLGNTLIGKTVVRSPPSIKVIRSVPQELHTNVLNPSCPPPCLSSRLSPVLKLTCYFRRFFRVVRVALPRPAGAPGLRLAPRRSHRKKTSNAPTPQIATASAIRIAKPSKRSCGSTMYSPFPASADYTTFVVRETIDLRSTSVIARKKYTAHAPNQQSFQPRYLRCARQILCLRYPSS